jgi:ABC-type Na+ efflux pump permease subunit
MIIIIMMVMMMIMMMMMMILDACGRLDEPQQLHLERAALGHVLTRLGRLLHRQETQSEG